MRVHGSRNPSVPVLNEILILVIWNKLSIFDTEDEPDTEDFALSSIW